MTTKIEYTLNHNPEALKKELELLETAESLSKDILIVVHNQVEYLKNCIESIFKYTTNFKLWIWDNGSDEETKTYLNELKLNPNVRVITSDANIGFIKPNNDMAAFGDADYIILLNSDTVVHEGWDIVMTGWLQTHPKVATVGYLGGFLNSEAKGVRFGFGSNVHYVCGWALCLSRAFYESFGLFDDKNLKFAYCEDSDFSLRIREAGYEIYVLHLDLVSHFENKTTKALWDSGDNTVKNSVQENFSANHRYVQERWCIFLKDNAL